jgi:hypothetical protein
VVRRTIRLAAPLLAIPCLACAVQYYDAATQTQHIYGIGHIAYKVTRPEAAPEAVIVGTDIFGLGMGTTASTGGVTLGYSSERRVEIIKRDASVTLGFPDSDLFNVVVGSAPSAPAGP